MTSAHSAPGATIGIGDIVLDRYRVVEQIGSGGHSVVWKGLDERLSRPVCIKLFSGLGGESGVGRTSYEHFVQEAFALSRLTHPNTLRIYDFGHLGPKDADGMPVQVCEYMNGGTLAQIIREEGKQSLVETNRIVSAMCAALGEAHALGIVHRDIKPQNILFGSVGTNRLPKLADFGIAKWNTDDDTPKENRAEDTAIVAGQRLAMYSPSWAAPEQLAGQPVTPGTDIYSLACVAIYMLSGMAIFADEDVYAGYKKRRQADELVREALAPLAIAPSVIDVLTHALSFDPKKRISTVDQFAAELHTAVEPETDEQARLTTAPVVHDPIAPAFVPVEPAPMAARVSVVAMPAPADPMSQIAQAPLVSAWMTGVQPVTGAARRLELSDAPQPVADRRVHFVMIADNVADLVGLHGTKVRITLIPEPRGRIVHVKGLTCFVAHLGGRPSSALQIDRSSDVALVTPRAQEIGHLRVAQGALHRSQVEFSIGNELVAVGLDDCGDPILFDFGPGSDAYFVYTRGRTVPKSGRRG